jgi:CrcB protein
VPGVNPEIDPEIDSEIDSEIDQVRDLGIDPDVDLRVRTDAAVLAAVSAGGVLGALARYGLSAAWPHAAGAFPWATWTINVTGCFMIGVLMVLIARRFPAQLLIRPFFGVGILGGYTTFSTAVVDVQHTAPGTALVYLAATLAGALLAVTAATALSERVVRSR